MDCFAEFYDELYPVSDNQKKFYEDYISKFTHPAKILSIGCGTGVMEHRLAKQAVDVTGIETIRELLESATNKYRNQLMSLRYFQMSTLEMTKFLGKKFYNIISCLNSRITFIKDRDAMKKFFFDCRELMSDGAYLFLDLYNFEKFRPEPHVNFPVKESIRVTYKSHLKKTEEGVFLNSHIQKDEKIMPVYEHVPVYLLQKQEIEEFAKEAGFSKIEFFTGFERLPFTQDSDTLLAVIS